MTNNPINPRIQHEFSLNSDITYLNHAAVAPWPARTRQAINLFAEENSSIGASQYPRWIKTESATREQLRSLINATSVNDIAFLKNTSEALSVVAYGLNWNSGDNIVTSNQEFPSNRIVWQSLSNKNVDLIEVDLYSSSSPEDAIINNCNNNTRLVSISSVQYASGLRMDLEKLGTFCREKNILFCIDAIQSIGALEFDVEKYQADFVMADAHKWMLSPEGIALFYCREDKRELLKLNQYGWHMIENHMDYTTKKWDVANSARRFECGSPNMLGIHALNASLSLLLEIGMENIENRLLSNTRYLVDQLMALSHISILSSMEDQRYAGIVTFKHDEANQSDLYSYLMKNNVICAERGGGIRFSPHFYTDKATMDRAVEIVGSFSS